MPLHESDKNHVARGLAAINHLIDANGGTGTSWSAATNLATFRSTTTTRQALAHEDQKAGFDVVNRYMGTLHALDIITDSDIAAANTTALWRTQFTEDNPSLAADLRGGRGD